MSYRKYDNGLLVRKEIWSKEFINTNPKKKSYYNSIKKLPDKESFVNLYGRRCIYCGFYFGDPYIVQLSHIEIDHFKPHSKYGHLKHDISNLVCSCRSCNRAKMAQEIDIHPDEGSLDDLFYRNDTYEICCRNETIQSTHIYNVLQYSKRFHKLNYLYEEISESDLDNDLKRKINEILLGKINREI